MSDATWLYVILSDANDSARISNSTRVTKWRFLDLKWFWLTQKDSWFWVILCVSDRLKTTELDSKWIFATIMNQIGPKRLRVSPFACKWLCVTTGLWLALSDYIGLSLAVSDSTGLWVALSDYVPWVTLQAREWLWMTIQACEWLCVTLQTCEWFWVTLQACEWLSDSTGLLVPLSYVTGQWVALSDSTSMWVAMCDSTGLWVAMNDYVPVSGSE